MSWLGWMPRDVKEAASSLVQMGGGGRNIQQLIIAPGKARKMRFGRTKQRVMFAIVMDATATGTSSRGKPKVAGGGLQPVQAELSAITPGNVGSVARELARLVDDRSKREEIGVWLCMAIFQWYQGIPVAFMYTPMQMGVMDMSQAGG